MDYFFKSLFKPKTMIDTMSPVLSSGGFMGLTPFKLSIVSGKPKTQFSIPYCIINVLLLVFYFYCIINVINLGEISFVLKRSIVFVCSEMLQIYVGFLAVVFIHVQKYYKQDFLAIHFKIAEQLSENFANLGWKINYRHLKIKLFFASILQLIFCIYLLLISALACQSLPDNEQLPVIIAIFWPSYTIAMTQFMGTSFIYVTWLNLRALNEEISKIPEVPHPISSNITILNIYKSENKYLLHLDALKLNSVLEKLDIIWEVYANISKNTNLLNDYFSLILLAIITSSFINTLFNIFYSYYAMVYVPKSLHTYQHIFLRVSKCLINGINMFILAIICNFCEEEVSL